MIEQQQGPTLGVRFREFSALERIKKYYWGTTGTTILVTNRWKRHRFLWITFIIHYNIHSSHFGSHSNVYVSFPDVEPRLFWSTERSVSRFLTSIAALGFGFRKVFALKCLFFFKKNNIYYTHTNYISLSTSVTEICHGSSCSSWAIIALGSSYCWTC